MNAVFNHLWQSTAFALAIATAAALLRRNSPRLRYWLWLTASLKFLIPFSLLVATGNRIQLPPDTPSLRATTVQQMSTYFAPVSVAPAPAAIPWTKGVIGIWLLGVSFLLIRWFRQWLALHAVARRASKQPLPCPVPVLSSPTPIEPGVFGIFRPVLLLPEGIAESLTPEQFDAILAHELRHVRYRDNLTAALHMCIETLFWFHPLVWYIGARLTDERERDCDEAVLREGNRPADYARGIVSVCQTYMESPLPCASGISGSDLKIRIREIMTWRGSLPVTVRGKAMLAVSAVAAFSIPFAIGVLRAQSLPPAPAYTYDVVSIHKSDPAAVNVRIGPGPQGGLRTENTPVMSLMTVAYGVQSYQIVDAPGWASSEHFDISFTPDKTEAAPKQGAPLKDVDAFMNRNAQRLQAVLRDRFRLVLRSETRESPIYSMTQAKGGHKLGPHDPNGRPGPSIQSNGGGQITGINISMEFLARTLSMQLHRPVHDNTHIDGQFDFKLKWTPDLEAPPEQTADGTNAPAAGASLFTALTDQLGLRLESTKGPVQVYVVEKLEHPSEN